MTLETIYAHVKTFEKKAFVLTIQQQVLPLDGIASDYISGPSLLTVKLID